MPALKPPTVAPFFSVASLYTAVYSSEASHVHSVVFQQCKVHSSFYHPNIFLPLLFMSSQPHCLFFSNTAGLPSLDAVFY